MTYIVLARKWRPMKFEEVIGQDHITQILKNALKNERIAHAYIFAGPRGVGKTTTARLLAKAVNCEKYPVINPCNNCASCKSITQGQNLDVIEIDGASNRGIDEIRNLRENIRFAPAASRYKIYIIDEVHMLTKEAFNALLKTLEEPPPHAIFIFATTEIHKVPLTILSRCQRFDFKRIATLKIQESLKLIADAEKISIEDDALFLIARKSDGSMRDAESILDQMISFGIENLTAQHIRDSLGLIDQEIYFEFTDLMNEKNSGQILQFSKKIFSSGHDLIDFLHGLQEHFRNLLLTAALKDTKQLEVADHLKERYEASAKAFREIDIIHYLHILGEAEQSVKFSFFPELTIEMLLLKLAHKPSHVQLEEILAFLEKIKKNTSSKNNPKADVESAKSRPVYSETPSQPLDHSKKNDNLINENKSSSSSQMNIEGLKNALKSYQKMGEVISIPRETPQDNIQLNLDEIQRLWGDLINKVKTTKGFLATVLEDGLPYSIEENQLTIAYDKSNAFAQEHIEKNSKVIESMLNSEFKIPLRIRIQSLDFKKLGIEQKPRTDEEILEDLKKKEPVLDELIGRFGLKKVLSSDLK
jgi:DNA polymerase-3 subunit gamma/tau